MEEGGREAGGTAAGSAMPGKLRAGLVPEGCGGFVRERALLRGEPGREGVRSRYPGNCFAFHSACGKGDVGSGQKSTSSKTGLYRRQKTESPCSAPKPLLVVFVRGQRLPSPTRLVGPLNGREDAVV